MKQIVIVKPTKRKTHWKNAIEGETHIKARPESGIHFLGYGFQEDTERIYIVEELESPDAAEKLFAKFENYPEEMGVDLSSVQIIPLED